jgi:ubiquinone/menaquinone biosynthesis C-methylase UbiE
MTIRDNAALRTFYDSLHRKSDLRFPLADYPYFANLLNIKPGSLVLDVGCGKGFFHRAGNGRWRGVGLDFSLEALNSAKNAGASGLVEGGAENLPFKDNAFDLAVNLGSLEHFLNKTGSVREMCRVVKKDGRIMIIVPNCRDLKTRWKLFRTGIGNDQDGQEETIFMTCAEWRDFLEGAGLAIERAVKYNGFAEIDWYYKRKDPDVITMTEKVARRLLTLFLRPLIPMNFSGYFIFICRSSPGKA